MVIVDIDGTIADPRHREHFLEPTLDLDECKKLKCPFLKSGPTRCIRPLPCEHKAITADKWNVFWDAEEIMKDGVVPFSREVLEVAVMFHTVVFITNRQEKTREATTLWLKEVFGFSQPVNLYMRPDNSSEGLVDFKIRTLGVVKVAHGPAEQIFAFEDDHAVAKGYGQNGIQVFLAPDCWDQVHKVMGLFV